MKCDICGLSWADVRTLYHKGTPVVHACTDCIADSRYEVHELVYADGSEWYVEDSVLGEIVSELYPTKAEAHFFISLRQQEAGTP